MARHARNTLDRQNAFGGNFPANKPLRNVSLRLTNGPCQFRLRSAAVDGMFQCFDTHAPYKTDVLCIVKTFVLEGQDNLPYSRADDVAAGKRVEQERMALGWTQQELATRVTRLGYEISQTGIDKIEKRDTRRPKCARELAKALSVTETWLVDGKEPKVIPLDSEIEAALRDLRQLSKEAQGNIFASLAALIDVAKKREKKKIP